MLDGPGTVLVTRTKWVRVPPPAFVSYDAGAGRPGGRLQPDLKQVRLLPASFLFPLHTVSSTSRVSDAGIDSRYRIL